MEFSYSKPSNISAFATYLTNNLVNLSEYEKINFELIDNNFVISSYVQWDFFDSENTILLATNFIQLTGGEFSIPEEFLNSSVKIGVKIGIGPIQASTGSFKLTKIWLSN